MTRSARLALAAIPAVVWSVPAAVRADAKGDAQVKAKEAAGLFKADKFAAAAAKYEEAYALFPSPKLSYNLGVCYLAIHDHGGRGQDLDAAEWFTKYLQESAADDEPEKQQVAKDALVRLKANLVQVRLQLSPADAQVTLERGGPTSPERRVRNPFFLRQGQAQDVHVLRIEAAGHRPAVLRFTTQQAGEAPLAAKLEPLVAATPVAALPVPAPTPRTDVPPARPEVTPLPLPPAEPVAAGGLTTPQPKAEESGGVGRVPAYVAMGIGGALAVGATVTSVLVARQYTSTPNLAVPGTTCELGQGCAVTAAEQDSLSFKSHLSTGLWVGAAAALATGTVLFFVLPSGDGPAGSGGEVGFTGRF